MLLTFVECVDEADNVHSCMALYLAQNFPELFDLVPNLITVDFKIREEASDQASVEMPKQLMGDSLESITTLVTVLEAVFKEEITGFGPFDVISF